MYSIDKSVKLPQLSLFLAKPNPKRTILGKLNFSFNKQNNIKFGKINELNLTVPYEITRNHKLIKNPMINLIRERYLIKAVLGKKEEWYIINKITKSDTDKDKLSLECFSLPYSLKYKRMRNYQVKTYNCIQVTEDCLSGTGWKIGYISPDFNLQYREFDVSSQTKLDFLFTICEKFKATPIFDTVNWAVSLYKEDELTLNKGLKFSPKRYLESITETIDLDEVCTRLYVSGHENISIHAVNPTGQPYIDDFSFYIYPFQRDENRNVISSSHYMTDELCHALLDYNILVSKKGDEFQSHLKNKKDLQKNLVTKQNELQILNDELVIILDKIEVAKQFSESLSRLTTEKNLKKKAVGLKKIEIENINADIQRIDDSTNKLKETLKYENNLSEELMLELYNYEYVQEWSDDSINNEDDLYNAAWEELKKRNSPPININISIVNFLEVLEEQHNWDKLVLGDIVTVYHEKLGIYYKTRIIEINYDFDNGAINLVISNSKKVESDDDKLVKAFYTIQHTSKDYNNRKVNWEQVANNFNIRNDRNKTIPTNPTVKKDGTAISFKENDNGTVDLTFEWSFTSSEIEDSKNNIDGYIVYMHSSDENEEYTFGSTLAKETMISLEKTVKRYVFPSVPSNRYYTFGVQSYRRVDTDIHEDGILKSEIISSARASDNPFQPKKTINIKGNIDGSVNGITHTAGTVPPDSPNVNDTWDDTVNNERKVYTDNGWQTQNAGNAKTVNGYSTSEDNSPNTIPVLDDNGSLNASITGDASTVGGKSADDFILGTEKGTANGIATLDSSGKINSSQLPTVQTPKMAFGTYTGNSTLNRAIQVGFKPNLIKIYTTNNTDSSVYIPSEMGGFLMSNNTTNQFLTSTVPSLAYGKISANGFNTGNTTSYYANKTGVNYYWEAYSNN